MKAIKTTIGNSGISLYVKALIAGTIFGAVISGTGLCMLAAILLIAGKIPYSALPYIVIFILSIGTFLSGYIVARMIKNKGLMFGAISGIIMFLLVLIIGLIMNTGTITILTLIKLLALTVSGGLGGIKGVNKKDKIRIK